MTKEQAEAFISYCKRVGINDCQDAAKLGKALVLLMSDEQKKEVREIIRKHLSRCG